MRYVVAIEKGSKKQADGVVVPDLPGCFSAGDTLNEAVTNAEEAVLLHLEGLMDQKKRVPPPKPLEVHQKDRRYKGWTWAVVEVEEPMAGFGKGALPAWCDGANACQCAPREP